MADEDEQRPADQPTPEPGTPAKPRGAGFDDDEWVRRDLGPRPAVPNHGARPVLIGIPILLITIAAIVAILVGGCGGDDEPSKASSGAAATTVDPATSGDQTTEHVQQTLTKDGQQIAGWSSGWGDELWKEVECEPTDSAIDFRCTYGAGVGGEDPATIRVRHQDDGTVTKILGSEPPVAGQKTSAQTAALLVSDDESSGMTKTSYTCATSTAINPDGTSAGSSATGQRCVLIRDGKVTRQRYVEFALDGTARRDFEVGAK